MSGTCQKIAGRDPIFIVGCGRSGTTLMRLMLNGYSRLAIPGETWYYFDRVDRLRPIVDSAPEDSWRKIVADSIVRFPSFRTLGVTAEQIGDELQKLSRARWSDVIAVANIAFARAEGKERWGDKTPGYVQQLRQVKRLFPNAFVLHMIRDGRDVVASYLKRTFGPDTALEAATYWQNHVLAGLSEGQHLFGSRYLEIRYESLVADPEGQLRMVCDCIGEEFQPGMLDSAATARKYIRPNLEFHSQTMEPVTAARIGNWRHDLTALDAQIIELEIGPLLRRLGYRTETKKSITSFWRWRHRFYLKLKVKARGMLGHLAQ